jgi:hypothetical protein
MTLMAPRPGHFDSGLREVGPPPLLTEKGIVMLYNGKNSERDADRDPNIGLGAYSAGQALLDPRNPARLLARTVVPFIKPELLGKRAVNTGPGPPSSKVSVTSRAGSSSITALRTRSSAWRRPPLRRGRRAWPELGSGN